MPTFNGFEGEKFAFKSSPNKFFNLLSDSYIQVNAHVNQFDNLDILGFKFGLPTTYINCNAAENIFAINDRPIYNRCHFPLGIQDHEGYTEQRYKFESNNFNISVLQAAGEFVNCLFIEAGKYHFYIIRNINRKLLPESPFFYNLVASVRNPNVRPHGLIGQTADFDGKPKISDGDPEDYEVNNLWSDNFKFNKFKEERIKIL